MKKLLLFCVVAFATLTLWGQSPTEVNLLSGSTLSPDANVAYRLFPTQYAWSFLKLDTRNGRVWKIDYATSRNEQKEVPVSVTRQVSEEEEQNGRFFLYSTRNLHTFILIDQVDGRTWQIGWTSRAKGEALIPTKINNGSLE